MAVVLNASGVNRVRFTVINNMKSLFHPQREIHYIGGTDILPPPLEPEEEAYVLSQLDTRRSEEAKALLIERNLRLVVYIAKKLIRNRIQNNAHLGNVELQTLQEVNLSVSVENKAENLVSGNVQGCVSLHESGIKSNVSEENKISCSNENEKKYNRVFARIFEITDLVDEIKMVLQNLNMKRLYLILDDYSEIDQL